MATDERREAMSTNQDDWQWWFNRPPEDRLRLIRQARTAQEPRPPGDKIPDCPPELITCGPCDRHYEHWKRYLGSMPQSLEPRQSGELQELINSELRHLQRKFEGLGTIGDEIFERLGRPAFERVAAFAASERGREPAPSAGSVCPTHGCPLETYTINGGVWLSEGKGFDTTPKTRSICPQCGDEFKYATPESGKEGETNVQTGTGCANSPSTSVHSDNPDVHPENLARCETDRKEEYWNCEDRRRVLLESMDHSYAVCHKITEER